MLGFCDPDKPMPTDKRQDIAQRFSQRSQAERYRDRFKRGRHRRTHHREVAALRALLDQFDGLDIILDVASGAGRFTPVFAEHARTIVQTDMSIQMISVSKETYADRPVLGHVQADARQLPFAGDSANLVFCHRLLNHLPNRTDRVRILSHLARVSKRFVTISCLTPPAVLRSIRRLYARLCGRPPVDGFVEVKDLLRDAEQVGLRLVQRTPIRSGIRSAAFLTFEKTAGTCSPGGPPTGSTSKITPIGA